MESLNYFKSLSDITRFRIFNILLHFELGVNEIVALMQMGQSRISRHLKILSDAGLLKCRRDGVCAFYSAAAKGPPYKFIQSIKYLFEAEKSFDNDLEQAAHILEMRKTFTTNFFNSIAVEWDRLKQEVLGGFDLNSEIQNHLQTCQIAVDLGCGTGEGMLKLAESAKRVIGVDSSVKMLELARKRFKNNGRTIDLRLGELEHLPLKDQEADCAVMSMVLHHLSNPREAVAEVYRILKSKGIYIIIEFQKHNDESMRKDYGDRWLGFSKYEIEDWLNQLHFSIRQVKTISLKRSLSLYLYRAIKI